MKRLTHRFVSAHPTQPHPNSIAESEIRKFKIVTKGIITLVFVFNVINIDAMSV